MGYDCVLVALARVTGLEYSYLMALRPQGHEVLWPKYQGGRRHRGWCVEEYITILALEHKVYLSPVYPVVMVQGVVYHEECVPEVDGILMLSRGHAIGLLAGEVVPVESWDCFWMVHRG